MLKQHRTTPFEDWLLALVVTAALMLWLVGRGRDQGYRKGYGQALQVRVEKIPVTEPDVDEARADGDVD